MSTEKKINLPELDSSGRYTLDLEPNPFLKFCRDNQMLRATISSEEFIKLFHQQQDLEQNIESVTIHDKTMITDDKT